MSRPEPIGRSDLRLRARSITDRLTVLTELWIAGAPPTGAQVRAVADNIARLQHAIAPGPLAAAVPPIEPTSR